jgi:fused signal recognition particle receptor
MAFFGLFGKEKKERLNRGLEKTRSGFFSRLAAILTGKSVVDDQVLDRLEEVLISSDVGVNTSLKIIQSLQQRLARDKYASMEELQTWLKEEIMHLLIDPHTDGYSPNPFTTSVRPYVILVVGVNGSGKTTTIGKLAYQLKESGKKVLLGAADTFRAAAVEQLTIWSQRAGVAIHSRGMGADPASVAYETVKAGLSQDFDVIIIDTAGRLHNKINLMNELSKIRRVIQKVIPEAPHEVLLVLDASTGQNAIEQARQFTAATEVNALALTKLDGTAKGGVIIGISDQFRIPVKYIGIGEQKEDLQLFDKKEFVDSLFNAALAS